MYKKILVFILLFSLSLATLPQVAFAGYFDVTKDKVGLNVHWSLGGFDRDNLYRDRLAESHTRWVREHFYTEVFLDNPEAWFARYDYVLNQYQKKNTKVVAMLAYGKDHDDFRAPQEATWKYFLQLVVNRYKDKVDVWEVWNEPDSPDYLTPNNPEAFERIMTVGYDTIKAIDPSAIVLNGGLSWPNYYFAEQMLQNYGNKFDALAFHVYYCGNWPQLEIELNRFDDMVKKYKSGQRYWVTEMGCSTGGTGISEERQKDYLYELTENLIASGKIEKILLYNIRNYDFRGEYEDNFGLLDLNMNPRPAWNWYANIPTGPYNKWRNVNLEQVKAAELKSELENKYFGTGLIPISAENWSTVVNSYTYGGYSVQAIVQAIRFGGKTVHPTISAGKWSQTDDYKNFINKNWTGGMIVHAYGKPRVLISTEQEKARELKEQLVANYNFSSLKIDQNNWVKLVNAYIYGGYPQEAIARAVKYGGKTVHPDIPWSAWKSTPDYQEFINKTI